MGIGLSQRVGAEVVHLPLGGSQVDATTANGGDDGTEGGGWMQSVGASCPRTA